MLSFAGHVFAGWNCFMNDLYQGKFCLIEKYFEGCRWNNYVSGCRKWMLCNYIKIGESQETLMNFMRRNGIPLIMAHHLTPGEKWENGLNRFIGRRRGISAARGKWDLIKQNIFRGRSWRLRAGKSRFVWFRVCGCPPTEIRKTPAGPGKQKAPFPEDQVRRKVFLGSKEGPIKKGKEPQPPIPAIPKCPSLRKSFVWWDLPRSGDVVQVQSSPVRKNPPRHGHY